MVTLAATDDRTKVLAAEITDSVHHARKHNVHCVPKNVHLFIFPITLSKVNRF